MNVNTNEAGQLQIVEWGNRLALRLSVSVVRQLGPCDRLSVQAAATPEGNLAIHPASRRQSAVAAELDAARAALPISKPVGYELRPTSWYGTQRSTTE